MKLFLLALSVLGLTAQAAPQGPIIWGSNNNALYLPTNKPSSGISCLTVDPLGVISPQTCGGGGGSGTVTSVGLSVPSWLTATGSPVTTSGTLGIAVPNQTAAKFLASPALATGALAPRAIVATDIPTLNQNTSGSAGSLSTNFTSGLPLIGQGTGIPGYGSKSGTTTQFATVSGPMVSGNCVKLDGNGNFISSGVPCNFADGNDQSVQYKGADSLFHGDSFFKYDYTAHRLYVPDLTLTVGTLKPLGLDISGRVEAWARSGNTKELASVSGSKLTGKCLAFDVDGNIVITSSDCSLAPVSGGVIIITANDSPTEDGLTILCDSATNITVQLPDISGQDGFKLQIKNINTGICFVDGFSSQLIDEETDWGLNHQFQAISIIAKAGNWYVY